MTARIVDAPAPRRLRWTMLLRWEQHRDQAQHWRRASSEAAAAGNWTHAGRCYGWALECAAAADFCLEMATWSRT